MESDLSSTSAETANPQDLLGGISTHGTGRFERAIEATLEGIAADPDFAIAYGNLALAYFFTDRFPEAESTLQRASARKLEMPRFLVLRYNIAVLKGDQEQMNRAVGLARGKGVAEHWMAHEEALALARSGRLQAARRSSNRAVDLALQEREPRGGSELRRRTSRVGSHLRECCRRKDERHGGARAFQGPGCRIRRRPCPGTFGRLFSIGGARRRFSKALSGRYFCELYLRTGSSRVSRTGSGQARGRRWSGWKSLVAMSWR